MTSTTTPGLSSSLRSLSLIQVNVLYVTDMYDHYNYIRALILIEKFVFDTGQCVVGDRHV